MTSAIELSRVDLGLQAQSGRSKALRFEILTRRADFAAIKTQWDNLFDVSDASPYLHHSFLAAWADTIGKHRKLSVRLAYSGRVLVAALPLCRGPSPMSFVPMGFGLVGVTGPMLDPSLDEASQVEALKNLFHLPRCGHICMEPLEEDVARKLHSIATLVGCKSELDATLRSEFADLPGTHQDWVAARSTSTQRRIRSIPRKIEGLPGFRRSSPCDDPKDLMEDYIEASRESWKTMNGTGQAATPQGRAFLRRLASDLPKAMVSIEIAYAEDRPIAAEFSMVRDGYVYCCTYEYAEPLSKLSLGRYIMYRAIARAYEAGSHRADFMRSSATQSEIATGSRPLYHLEIWRPSNPLAFLRFWPRLKNRLNKLRRAGSSARAATLARQKSKDKS